MNLIIFKNLIVLFSIFLTPRISTLVASEDDVETNEIESEVILHNLQLNHQKVLENQSKKSKVSCPEISPNAVFTNDHPYNILGVPQCLSKKYGKDALEARLYLSEEVDFCLLDMEYLPNKKSKHCLDKLRKHSPTIDKVVILIHGFLSHYDRQWLLDMKDAILSVEERTAVIILGWGKKPSLKDITKYHQAAANTRYVAAGLFELMKTIHEETTNTWYEFLPKFIPHIFGWQEPLYTHCIGHSLGAHICGQAGKILNEQSIVPRWDRISGMDPAGPLFFNDVPAPFNGYNCTSASRLNRTDAKFVDVIHTDGNAEYLFHHHKDPIQFGTLTRVGTVDFYPGTGKGAYGSYQPGCRKIGDVGACSHSKSHEYYYASIKDAVCLASRFCDGGDASDYPEKCKDLLRNRKIQVVMGYWWTMSDMTPGEYTVEIKEESPFCSGGRF